MVTACDIRTGLGPCTQFTTITELQGIVGSVGPTEDQEEVRGPCCDLPSRSSGSSGRGPIKEITVIPGGDCHDGVAPGRGWGSSKSRAFLPSLGALADQETLGQN